MWIRSVTIRNIRSIAHLTWAQREPGPGWNVILGDNGSGKSSFLRSVALALVGPKEAAAARQAWLTWLRSGEQRGWVMVEVTRDEEFDTFSGKGRTGGELVAAVGIERDNGTARVEARKALGVKMGAERHVWGTGRGWFSAGYGPFRRFSGGDKEAERSFLANPKLGAHLSVFGENVALNESLYWLRELNYKRLEGGKDGGLLQHLEAFVNQDGFLPHKIRLKGISSEGVGFEDANGFDVDVEELSDGYRSVLSMTFELIRQLSRLYAPEEIFDEDDRCVIAPGTVLIDEIDAHLHPTWQRRIGVWLTEHFPRMQFLVATHSPLVCQAAAGNGSVFLLSQPGEGGGGKMLQGGALDRLLYGDILDAYGTGAFGTGETRSAAARRMRERLAELNVKELRSKLTKEEAAEQDRLRAAFPTQPHSLRSR